MKWFFTTAENNDFKPHIIPEVLYEKVINSLYSRGCSTLRKEVTVKSTLDLPGMIMIKRHIHDIYVDSLDIMMPSTDVEAFLQYLLGLKAREEIGVKYYKLHGFGRCICLTSNQRNEFIKNLQIILPDATAIANAENKLFNKKILNQKNKNFLVALRPVINNKIH